MAFDCGYQNTVSDSIPKEFIKFVTNDTQLTPPVPDNKAMYVKKCMVAALARKIHPSPSYLMMEKTRIDGIRHSVFNSKGNAYIGEWKKDTRSGHGIFKSHDSARELYEGEWENGKPDGYGILCHRGEHNRYDIFHEGFWEKGKFQGFGRHFYKDGSYYEGGWENGKKEDFGRLWYVNGTYYEGQFFNNKRHGRGMFVYVNGDRYIGTWEANQKQGFGAYYHLTTGQVQMGHWKQDSCITSWIMDLEYRQTVVNPTPFPIPEKPRVVKHFKINDEVPSPETKTAASQTGE